MGDHMFGRRVNFRIFWILGEIMKAKIWLISWLVIVVSALSIIGFYVYKIDPFFHYHKPDLDEYYYTLDNQRSQNDGITKHFNYDAIITGTSMTENFRKTEVDEIFGCDAIKVPFSGGRYKEVNDNVERGLKANDNIRLVIRCLDTLEGYTINDDTYMREDLGMYPTYLYDDNPFNDVQYIWNRDIIFGRVYQMTIDNDKEDFISGIRSFDEYSRWQSLYTFGINTVVPNGITDIVPENEIHLTEDEKIIIKKNIEENVIAVADNNPNVDFYYFFPPYSIKSWSNWKNDGVLYKNLEIEAYMMELIVPHRNIHLYSFNNRTDIIMDLNNYKDDWHYACWVNSLILKWMHDGQYQLTEDNYKDYLKQEYDFYTTFDYASVNDQEDYEADFYAAALLNKELTGVDPIDVLNDDQMHVSINGAEVYKDNDGRYTYVSCHGTLARDYNTEPLADYIRDKGFIGIKFDVNLNDGYNYLSFYGQKIMDQGRLTAYVYDENGIVVREIEVNYPDLDNEVHQYVIDLSTISGKVTVVLNGAFVDYTGNPDSQYQFSNIYIF